MLAIDTENINIRVVLVFIVEFVDDSSPFIHMSTPRDEAAVI